MLVLPLVLAVIAWYLIICLKWKKTIFDVMEKLPGPRWYPILGTFNVFVSSSRADVIYKFLEVTLKNRPFYRSWNGNVHEVHLTKPEHLQIVLKSSTHTPKGPFYHYLKPWLGDGVFTSEGAKWFLQRKMLTPTFHFKILEEFVETFGEKANLLAARLSSKADGNYFSILPLLHVTTLDVICDTAMGIPLSKVTDKPLEYVYNTHDITELAMWRYWRPWITDSIFYLLPQGRHYRKKVKAVHDFADKVVACRKEILRKDADAKACAEDRKKKRLSFMDMVLDAKENHIFSDTDLRDMVNTFIFAGFETTGNTLGWALFLLGNNLEIQEKAFEEACSVLKDKDAPTTMTELNELKYIDCIAKETLRLYPVLPFLTRRTTEEIDLDGHKVPIGTQAIIHIFVAQRDPENYSDPDKFIPERFTPENSKNRHPFSFIPFSAGPRNCLGMRFALIEMRSMIATIVKKFKITSLHTPEEVKVFAHLLIRPQIELQIKLERRSND